MENVTLSTLTGLVGEGAVQSVRHDPGRDDTNSADEMKQIRRAKLRRMANADPSLVGKLVALEASPVYNARGDLIQTLGASFATV